MPLLSQVLQGIEMSKQGLVGRQRLNSSLKSAAQALQVRPWQLMQFLEQQSAGLVHWSQMTGLRVQDAQLLM